MARKSVRPDVSDLPRRVVVGASCPVLMQRVKDALPSMDICSEVEDAEPRFGNDERCREYDVLAHRFDAIAKTVDVHEYFLPKGYRGIASAFVAWIAEARPVGFYATIPPDEKSLWKKPGRDGLYTLCFRSDGTRGDLYLDSVNGFWSKAWTFVAFRPVGFARPSP
ncbi:hypothetical protein L0Y59_01870 [Candidatus Uhrbacteria bacterium]|nr:hypothetical protein [Candidatus Uhrbacteria bacterium]